MKKYEVKIVESCILESTLIVEGNFPKNDDELWDAIQEIALEGMMNGEGSERCINSDIVDWNWKEVD